jgi:hypothetical protein
MQMVQAGQQRRRRIVLIGRRGSRAMIVLLTERAHSHCEK